MAGPCGSSLISISQFYHQHQSHKQAGLVATSRCEPAPPQQQSKAHVLDAISHHNASRACFVTLRVCSQVEVEDPERYRYDGECLLKAEEMGHPGIVDIQQKQVRLGEGTQGPFRMDKKQWADLRPRSCSCRGSWHRFQPVCGTKQPHGLDKSTSAIICRIEVAAGRLPLTAASKLHCSLLSLSRLSASDAVAAIR